MRKIILFDEPTDASAQPSDASELVTPETEAAYVEGDATGDLAEGEADEGEEAPWSASVEPSAPILPVMPVTAPAPPLATVVSMPVESRRAAPEPRHEEPSAALHGPEGVQRMPQGEARPSGPVRLAPAPSQQPMPSQPFTGRPRSPQPPPQPSFQGYQYQGSPGQPTGQPMGPYPYPSHPGPLPAGPFHGGPVPNRPMGPRSAPPLGPFRLGVFVEWTGKRLADRLREVADVCEAEAMMLEKAHAAPSPAPSDEEVALAQVVEGLLSKRLALRLLQRTHDLRVRAVYLRRLATDLLPHGVYGLAEAEMARLFLPPGATDLFSL